MLRLGCQSSGELLSMGIAIWVPVSSVEGSPLYFFAQPLISGKVWASAAVLIGTELFLFLAQRLFSLECDIPNIPEDGPVIQMPVAELQQFLRTIASNGGGKANGNSVPGIIAEDSGRTVEVSSTEIKEAPVVIGLYAVADYSTQSFSPAAYFLVPIFTLPGTNGSLPLLILELLDTIFVRAVVPPEATGAKPVPLKNPNTLAPIQLNPEDLINILNRFGKHFGKT